MAKFKNLSGLLSEEGRKSSYESVDFYVRTESGDIKFRTLSLARKTAIEMNKCVGKVVCRVVKKYTYAEIDAKGKILKEDKYELEDSLSTQEFILKHGS